MTVEPLAATAGLVVGALKAMSDTPLAAVMETETSPFSVSPPVDSYGMVNVPVPAAAPAVILKVQVLGARVTVERVAEGLSGSLQETAYLPSVA